MKINNNKIMLGVAVLVLAGCVIAMLRRKKTAVASPVGGKFIVYGTEWCGYTTKQREHLNNKYGSNSHDFIDCDKETCPGINAFPVTKTPSGDMVKGFNTDL